MKWTNSLDVPEVTSANCPNIYSKLPDFGLDSKRFTDHHLNEYLLARTKLYFGHAIHQEPSKPLTQALSHSTAREIVVEATYRKHGRMMGSAFQWQSTLACLLVHGKIETRWKQRNCDEIGSHNSLLGLVALGTKSLSSILVGIPLRMRTT